jgi:hypothetical protein
MKSEKRFKVKYGYTIADQVSIDETELEKALYAQKFGEVVQLGNKQVNGRNIIVIEPHWHYYTGWYDYYEPLNGDDFAQIERDAPKELLEGMIRNYRERVDYLINTGRKNLIGKNVSLPELDKPKEEIKSLPKDINSKIAEISSKYKA